MWRCKSKWGLSPFIFLLAFPALAAFDLNDVKLGATEKEIKQRFPQVHCRPLEWPTKAADRRCDESRIKLANLDASVTFYLRQDSLEGFDVRFEKAVLPAMSKFLLERYGAPSATGGGDMKYEWKSNSERARVSAEEGRRRASLFVWRGAFEEELYKVR